MSIDEFGLGDWWPRPDQAAAGALDHLSPDQWPMLAAKWLAAGFESDLLRQFAAPRSGDDRTTYEAQDLMPEVMRSIGFDPAPADKEFTARCQQAVEIVQHDLDATGYGRYQMRARLGRGWPATVFATLPDGSYWGGGGGMSRRADGSRLLVSAAESVSATIEEVHEIEWPVCAAHGNEPFVRPSEVEEPVALIKNNAWWWCIRAAHALAPVGQLTASIARTL